MTSFLDLLDTEPDDAFATMVEADRLREERAQRERANAIRVTRVRAHVRRGKPVDSLLGLCGYVPNRWGVEALIQATWGGGVFSGSAWLL